MHCRLARTRPERAISAQLDVTTPGAARTALANGWLTG
jgi:hypothetical protein